MGYNGARTVFDLIDDCQTFLFLCFRAQWRKTRVDRMLVEHFLRVGYYDTAVSLAKHFEIEDLTNINLFLVAKDVEEALSTKGKSYMTS